MIARSAPLVPTALLAALTLLATTALAGPPCVCHPVNVERQATLPWGTGAFETAGTYPREAVVADTLARLTPDAAVLVRMETLRRAAIYLENDLAERTVLLEALERRVLDAEASGRPDALAWFDAGYLAQIYDQYGARSRGWTGGERKGVVGYAWVLRAIALKGDPQMELAAAMMTLMAADRSLPAGHLARAEQGAKRDPLLAKNLKRLLPMFHDHRPELRKRRS